jgi:tetratricopeptide (TPR) repeat protein
MSQATKRPPTHVELPQGSAVAMLAERPQLDFELAFFGSILEKMPEYSDVLRAQAANFTQKGMLKEGLKIDQALVAIRPDDADARYNLACRYALLRQPDLAIDTLRKAVELGYSDFRFMIQDRDLEILRKDPRFRQLLRQYADR